LPAQALIMRLITRLGVLRLGLSLSLSLLLSWAAGCGHEQPLPRYGPLPAFSLQSQRGQTITRHELLGSVVVVDFIFTSCPDVCPLLTEQLLALHKQLPAQAPIRFVSFSVDPEHDTPERLRQFAVQHGADLANWWFLTGPLDEVKRVVVQGFKQAMQAQPVAADKPPNVLHGTHFVLVDRAGELRGFYPSDEAGRKALGADVTALLSAKGSS
jgi:protein SCO1/2